MQKAGRSQLQPSGDHFLTGSRNAAASKQELCSVNSLDVFHLFVVQITIYECVFHAFKAATQLTPCILGVSIILLREARTEAVFHGLFMSSNLRMTFSNSKKPHKT